MHNGVEQEEYDTVNIAALCALTVLQRRTLLLPMFVLAPLFFFLIILPLRVGGSFPSAFFLFFFVPPLVISFRAFDL